MEAEFDPSEFAYQLFDEANRAREQAGLQPLELSECAQPFAEQRAAALVGMADLVHASLFDLNQSCRLAGGASGENLLRGVGTPQEMVEAWLNSPSHRDNLLNPDFTAGAMACVLDPEEAVPDHPETGDNGNYRVLCSHLFLG